MSTCICIINEYNIYITYIYTTNIEAMLTWTYRIQPLKPHPDKSLKHTQTIPWLLPVKKA